MSARSGEWPITGQRQAVRLLKGAIASGRLAHAYLLVGPSGCGKTSLARAFAQTLNCAGDNPPCNDCGSCLRIARGQDFDVREIDLLEKRQQIQIDQVREFQRRASLKSTGGRYKIAIVPRAELFSIEASNAFLKILEEPPSDTLIILATAAKRAVLETLSSRCIVVTMHTPSRHEIRNLISEVSGLAEPDREFILQHAEARPGWALEVATDPKKLDNLKETNGTLTEGLRGDVESRLEMAEDFASGRSAALENLGALAQHLAVVGRAAATASAPDRDAAQQLHFFTDWAANLAGIRSGMDALNANTLVSVTVENVLLELRDLRSPAGSLI